MAGEKSSGVNRNAAPAHGAAGEGMPADERPRTPAACRLLSGMLLGLLPPFLLSVSTAARTLEPPYESLNAANLVSERFMQAGAVRHREIWLTGMVTEQAGAVLAANGWIPYTHAHQRLPAR